MTNHPELPFFVSIPHSGEKVPVEVSWLSQLDEVTLMRDVDRYVDALYEPAINKLKIPSIVSPWHRYVIDLNRKEDEYDANAVVGAPHPAGTHPKGLHWSVTTHNETLISQPMSSELHEKLLRDYYKPFHDSVLQLRQRLLESFGVVYHLDLHSMPSLGTSFHPDPGEERAEVVISDQHGNSCTFVYRELVFRAFQKAGFQVAYNWPYIGGGITKRYGEPEKGYNTIQIELNRAQYMNETTKQKAGGFADLQKQLEQAFTEVKAGVKDLLDG
jgi:N-formylglutamate deformylase